jgi:hypothetical protein
MKAVTGVFSSQSYALRALAQLRALGLTEDRLTLLAPGGADTHEGAIPTVSAEQPGMGKAMGALVGAATGLSGGPLLVAALIPGVGPITVIGLLGGAVVAAAGAGVGAAVGGELENAATEGLPEDEIFVYEDALRKGRSVVIVLADDDVEASLFRELLKAEGAESIDAAREQWWIGLRSAEQEHYSGHGKKFGNDEEFYRRGFEFALDARTRRKEYDQVLPEMAAKIEELKRQYPGVEVAEPSGGVSSVAGITTSNSGVNRTPRKAKTNSPPALTSLRAVRWTVWD